MKLITYLQLLYEGRIEKIAGIDWSATIASARLNYLQLKKLKDEVSVEEKLRQQVKEQIKKTGVEDLKKTVSEIEKAITAIAEFVSSSVIVSMQSGDEVGQQVLAKFKKRKRRDKQ